MECALEGFVDSTDKWLQDSVKDIRSSLNNRSFHPNKGFKGSEALYTVVDDPSKADLTLTVVARGTNAAQFGSRSTLTVYRGIAFVDTVPNIGMTRWVSAEITVGTYRKEIVAWATNRPVFSAGSWTLDAKNLGLLTADWVMQNEERLLELREAK